MNVRQLVVISNPRTGRYSSNRVSINEICVRLQALGWLVDLQETTTPGDATNIAARAARDRIDAVIAAGGDGTINEVLQGLVGTETRLGLIPRGTANVLARDLGIPLDEPGAIEVIHKNRTRRIHVGSAINERDGTRRYFVLMAGIGLDASVVRRVHPRLKKRLGKVAFWLSGLSHLADWQPTVFQLEAEGQTLSATFAAIGKARGYGGDLAITPRARLDHPEFEVCVITSRSRMRYLRLLRHVMSGGVPPDTPDVSYFTTERVKATGNALVQIDGELIGELPYSFEIAKETLEVFVP
jgi:YegS/Rv2252/BmrU family lipid kinase